MNWTTEKPTKPGWYWYRWNHGTPRTVHLLHAMGDERLYREDERGYVHEVDCGSLSEWQGPITPTEEPQKSECGHYECNEEDCYGK